MATTKIMSTTMEIQLPSSKESNPSQMDIRQPFLLLLSVAKVCWPLGNVLDHLEGLSILKNGICIHLRTCPWHASTTACLSYFNISVIFKAQPNTIRPTLEGLFAFHEDGVSAPVLPLPVHGVSELETVCRTTQGGQNVGRIEIKVSPDERVKVTLDSRPSTVLRPDTTSTSLSSSRWSWRAGKEHGWLISRTWCKQPHPIGTLCCPDAEIKASH